MIKTSKIGRFLKGVPAVLIGLVLITNLSLGVALIFPSDKAEADATCQNYQSPCDYLSGNTDWQIWQNTEPGGGGWFMDVSFGPDDTIIAASDLGGYYRSSDDGASWTKHGSSSGLTSTHVRSIAHHPVDANLVLFGTGERGIYKSSDGGLTVTRTLSLSRKVCSIETTGTVAYAAVATAWNTGCNMIYTSSNSGDTWGLTHTFVDDVNIVDLRINPADSTNVIGISQQARFYDPTDKNLYETEDSFAAVDQVPMVDDIFGADWSTDGSTLYFTSVGASNTGSLYTKAVGYNSPQTLVNSNFSGAVWVPAGTTNTIRLIDQRIYGAANPRQGINESTNGGSSFTRTAEWPTDFDFGWGAGNQFTSFYYINFSFSKTNPDYAGYVTSQQIIATLDGGHSLEQLNSRSVGSGWNTTGINNTVPVTTAQHPLDRDLIIQGMADVGCQLSEDGGESWEDCNQDAFNGDWGANRGGNVQAIVMDPDDVDKMWMASGRQSGDSYLIKTTTGPDKGNWFDSGTGLPAPNDYVNDIVLDSSSTPGSRTLFSVVDGDVYRSTNDGANWSLVFACGSCMRVEVDPESNLVAAGGNSGLYASNTNGDLGTWSSIALGTYGGGSGDIRSSSYTGVADITDDQNSSGVLWVALNDETNGGIYRYESGSAVLSEANQDTRTVEVADDGIIYYGASNAFNSGSNSSQDSTGIRYSTNGGASWNQLTTPLAYPFVVDIVIPENDQNTMWVVSPGPGVYKVYRYQEETDLSVSITDGITEIEEGQDVTYTTTVTNNGTRPVNSFTIGQLPFGGAVTLKTFMQIQSGGGSLTPASYVTYNWTGTLNGGESIVFTQVFTATGSVGAVENMAVSISTFDNSAGSLYETNSSNNSSNDNDTAIVAGASVVIDDPETEVGEIGSETGQGTPGALATTGVFALTYLIFGSLILYMVKLISRKRHYIYRYYQK